MRVYLTIIDETDEAQKALRFAANRAAATGGAVHILALVQPQNFNAFGGVQATIEQEARDRAEAIANGAAGALMDDEGRMPTITVKVGEGQAVIREYLESHSEVAALVLGSSDGASPGPLVAHFSASAGKLSCPLYILPGGITKDEIDRLSS